MTHGRSTHYLLVEDNDSQAMLTRRTLVENRPSDTVERVACGDEAARYLRGEPPYEGRQLPDIVLLDLKMPGMDGQELLRLIRADERLQMIPVIILTTSSAETDRKTAYRAGANGYMVKPMNYRQYRQMLIDFSNYWGEWNKPATNHTH